MRIMFIVKSTFSEPLGVMTLISMIKDKAECELIVWDFEKNPFEKVIKLAPEVICYYATTGAHKFLLDINKEMKKKIDFISVFGGPHPTFFNEIINEEGVDIICIGEGEYALLELIERLQNKRDIKHIRNLYVKERGKIYKNPLRPLIGNLDKLPFPDRDLLYKYNQFKNSKTRSFMISRGCLYNCSYCFNHKFRELYKNKGDYYRVRSVRNIIREIKTVKERFGMDRVCFWDDYFNLNEKWVKEFCRIYKREIGLPFILLLNPKKVRERIVRMLREAGLFMVSIGIESGNERIRRSVLRREISNQDIINACRILKKEGIIIKSLNLLGIPNESLEDIYTTIQLNSKCKVDDAVAFLLQPYPKTDLWKYCMENNLFDNNFDNLPDSSFADYKLRSNFKRELINLQRLFPLLVRFHFLALFSRILIKLPNNKIFDFVSVINRKIMNAILLPKKRI